MLVFVGRRVCFGIVFIVLGGIQEALADEAVQILNAIEEQPQILALGEMNHEEPRNYALECSP